MRKYYPYTEKQLKDYQNNSEKVLITGGSGFLGRNLSKFLSEKGYKILATYHNRKPEHIISKNITWMRVKNIFLESDWAEFLKEIDYVIHLIGLAHVFDKDNINMLDKFMEINVNGTQALVRSCLMAKSIKKFIYVSSISAISSFSSLPLDEKSLCRPDSAYGISKLKAENVIKSILRDRLCWCILRPPLIYGPGDLGNLKRLINLVKKGIPLPFSSINNKRNFLYIDNFSETVHKILLDQNSCFKTYVISDNESISTVQLIKVIARELNKKIILFPFPVSGINAIGLIGDLFKKIFKIEFGINSYSVERLIRSLVIDNSLVKRDLSFDMPYSLYEGLKRTIKSEIMGSI